MNEIVKFLSENPLQYLATIGPDGKPKVRPFQFMLEQEGKLWFCTNSQKEVYAQLAANPAVEVCVASPGNAWIRLTGEARFEDNAAVKKAVIEKSPLVRSLYGSAENPIFVVFYLADAKAVIADFSGNPPRTFTL